MRGLARRDPTLFRRFGALLFVAWLATLAGCTTMEETKPELDSETPEQPVEIPSAVQIEAPTPVAVIVAHTVPLYTRVADELTTRLDRPFLRYSVGDNPKSLVASQIRASRARIIVAIGLDAVRAAEAVEGASVIYAQVADVTSLSQQDHWGVDAIPPFELQLSEWRKVAPELQAIGAIASSNMRGRLDELREAALALELSLEIVEVKTDKEALWRFRQMVPRIHGFVLLPDESVLSPEVIKGILESAAKHGKQVLVYHQALFDLGAFMLVAADEENVAERILTLIDEVERAPPSSGQPRSTARVLPLTALRVQHRVQTHASQLYD